MCVRHVPHDMVPSSLTRNAARAKVVGRAGRASSPGDARASTGEVVSSSCMLIDHTVELSFLCSFLVMRIEPPLFSRTHARPTYTNLEDQGVANRP